MNTIEKIIAESKTQKEAGEKIRILATKYGIILADSDFVKNYKKGAAWAFTATEQFLKAEAEYNRKQTIKYLANHLPLNTIDEAVADLDSGIAEWTDKVKESPEYYLSWGEGAFRDAAKRQVLLVIRHWLNRTDDLVGTYDDPNFWPEIEKHITKQAINFASSMPSSTSYTSNLMASRMIEAWAEAARPSFSTFGRIAHWFATKTEIRATMAEIIQAGEPEINVTELAKAIL